jgi:hypothetical protein
MRPRWAKGRTNAGNHRKVAAWPPTCARCSVGKTGVGPPPHAARVLLASHALSKVEVEDETCLMLAQIHERGSRPSRVLMELLQIGSLPRQGSLRLSPTLAARPVRGRCVPSCRQTACRPIAGSASGALAQSGWHVVAQACIAATGKMMKGAQRRTCIGHTDWAM